jgi:hypothetical protein
MAIETVCQPWPQLDNTGRRLGRLNLYLFQGGISIRFMHAFGPLLGQSGITYLNRRGAKT